MKILILSDIQDHAKKCAEGLLELGNDIVYAYPKGMVTKGVKLDNRISKVELPYGGGKNYFLNFYLHLHFLHLQFHNYSLIQ